MKPAIAWSPPRPGDRCYLITGKLSAAGQAERARRVRAGEDDAAVYAELLVKEGKAVPGQAEPAPDRSP